MSLQQRAMIAKFQSAVATCPSLQWDGTGEVNSHVSKWRKRTRGQKLTRLPEKAAEVHSARLQGPHWRQIHKSRRLRAQQPGCRILEYNSAMPNNCNVGLHQGHEEEWDSHHLRRGTGWNQKAVVPRCKPEEISQEPIHHCEPTHLDG